MKRHLVSKRAWLIWALAAGFFFAEYFARVAPSVMVEELMRAFRVDAFSLGALSAFFYYAYVAMQLPVGAIVDRFGAHRSITIAAAVCGLSSFWFAHAHNLEVAELMRFVMGLSAAFAFVGALKLASSWFPLSHFGLIAGATQALGMLGAAVGEGPVSMLVQQIGWRDAMAMIGVVLIVLAILIGWFVQDKPHDLTSTKRLPIPKQFPVLAGIVRVFKNRQNWFNAIFVGFLFAPTAAFAELWGATYLHNVYRFSHAVSASAISMIFIGWAIGAPLAGWISDRIKRRKIVLLFSASSSLITMSCVLYISQLSVAGLFVLLFLYGMSNVGVAISYVVARESNSKALAGTAMSLANMASVIIGACFQPIIGWLLVKHSDGAIINGVHVYSVQDYKFAMITLPLCFVVSLLSLVFLRESYGANE